MSWWRNFFGIVGGADEAKMTSAELDAIIRGGRMSGSGAQVNLQTSLQVTTVLACARVIANGVAQVPFKVYVGGSGRREAPEHPLYDLISKQPNPFQTSFEFRETMVFHALLCRAAYIHKLRVGSERRIASLELLDPMRTRVKQETDGRLRYWTRRDDGAEVEIAAADIWHVRGPSWNGWEGMELLKLAREAIGLAIATEAAHADFHRNGARVSGFYSFEGNITSEQYEALSKRLAKYAQGGPYAGKPAILDRDAKFQNMQMTGVDAEHIATRKLQIEEICRAFGVIPLMIGQSDKTATYASVEQLLIAHVVHTLMPWYERIENSADVNLLTEQDRRAGFYTKFNPNSLLRGSAEARAKFFATALGAGGQPAWMTQDEVRGLEELEPMGGTAGELNPGSMGQQAATNPNAGA